MFYASVLCYLKICPGIFGLGWQSVSTLLSGSWRSVTTLLSGLILWMPMILRIQLLARYTLYSEVEVARLIVIDSSFIERSKNMSVQS